MEKNIYTMAEMIRDFGSYRRQIKAVIKRNSIPHETISRVIHVDRAGYEAVQKGLEEFRNRPVVARLADSSV